jgi:ribosomal protein S18 acetylase RimI-like enzyme
MFILHDKEEIRSFLQQNVFLHLYSIGDLDDFFWNYTSWYASRQNGSVEAIMLMYTGLPLPTLLALGDHIEPLKALFRSTMHLLPRRFYAHFSPGLEEIIAQQYNLHSYGEHYKMALKDKAKLNRIDGSQAERLSKHDLEAISTLFQVSYPENWFDPRMLETQQYFGVKAGEELLSIAGIHVYSEQYGVAALGNITTHPAYRGQGLAKAVTAKLCQSLSEKIDHIGLNVKTNNQTAVSLYRQLGFEPIATYTEYMVELR